MTQESPVETLLAKYTQVWDSFKTTTPLTKEQLGQRYYGDDNVVLF